MFILWIHKVIKSDLRQRLMINADLFDDVQNPLKSRNIVLVRDVISPRRVNEKSRLRIEREEREVAVCHVVFLGAEQKLSHDRLLGVTEHDHCQTHHIICSVWNRQFKTEMIKSRFIRSHSHPFPLIIFPFLPIPIPIDCNIYIAAISHSTIVLTDTRTG